MMDMDRLLASGKLFIAEYAERDKSAVYSASEEFLLYMKQPNKVIFHNPATIVFWKDGSKTVVKCQEGDTYDREKGLLLCYVKKWVGNNKSRNLNDILKYAEVEDETEDDTPSIIGDIVNLVVDNLKGLKGEEKK